DVPAPKPVEAVKPPEPKVAEAPKPEPVAVAEAPKPAPVAEEPKPVMAEAPKPEPVATRTVDGGGSSLKEAFGKAQKAPENTAADGSWTVQLSAYQDRGEADRFAAGLRDKGYAPYIVEATIAGKGTWYRVRMGRFGSKDAASRYKEDFQRETAMNAIVTQN
ncbi:MAG TPA: SPOR domain-containing protein, partial [Archangium sp.]